MFEPPCSSLLSAYQILEMLSQSFWKKPRHVLSVLLEAPPLHHRLLRLCLQRSVLTLVVAVCTSICRVLQRLR